MSTFTFEIDNSSDYNTEDLRTLVNATYARVSERGRDSRGLPALRGYANGDFGHLTFRTYTGQVLTDRQYVGSRHVRDERKWQGRTNWRKLSDIPLIPADKLYASPLEAISARANGTEYVPQHMVKQLARYLLSFTASFGSDRDRVKMAVEEMPDIAVRVDRTTEGKVKRNRLTVARERLEQYPDSLEYRFGQLSRCIRNVERLAVGVRKEAGVLGIEVQGMDSLRALYREASELDAKLRAAVAAAMEDE